jgi:hypothetical protein
MYKLGSKDGEVVAIEWDLMTLLLGSGTGWVKGGPKLSSETWTSESCPGGENSGWPGSRSKSATPTTSVEFLGEASFRVDRSLLTRNFAKVDFPDDFGPHTMKVRGTRPDNVEHLATISFHSGGEIKGWRKVFGGPSFEEKSCFVISLME